MILQPPKSSNLNGRHHAYGLAGIRTDHLAYRVSKIDAALSSAAETQHIRSPNQQTSSLTRQPHMHGPPDLPGGSASLAPHKFCQRTPTQIIRGAPYSHFRFHRRHGIKQISYLAVQISWCRRPQHQTKTWVLKSAIYFLSGHIVPLSLLTRLVRSGPVPALVTIRGKPRRTTDKPRV